MSTIGFWISQPSVEDGLKEGERLGCRPELKTVAVKVEEGSWTCLQLHVGTHMCGAGGERPCLCISGVAN